MIRFELYGVPRLRAGIARVDFAVETLGEALDALTAACPGLAGSVVEAGRIRPSYVLSLNGERFVSDRGLALSSGDVLLLISADVGG